MDRFQAMQVFTRVVDANSFSAAADSLGLPRATVTTTIQNLEKRLKVRLLNRTTRRLSLTPDGAAYYERCVRILDDLEDAEATFIDHARGPRGRLRIDVPPVIGRQLLIPNLCEFHQRYPDLEIMIGMTDRPVDMVREAVDCVIRIGELRDSSLIARRIGTFRSMVCAAPEYIERHGIPTSIEDLLENHQAVHYFSSRTGRNIDWDFLVAGETTEIKMRGVVSVNDGDAYVACGVQGFGLIQPARFMVFRELQRGDLIEVLPHLEATPMPISVLYQHNKHLSPKVRVFADWVAELFAACPLSSGCQLGSESPCTRGNPATSGNTLRSLTAAHNLAESLLQEAESALPRPN